MLSQWKTKKIVDFFKLKKIEYHVKQQHNNYSTLNGSVHKHETHLMVQK